MRWFMKRLYRERRRLTIVAAATFLGGYFAFFNSTSVFLGIPFPIIAGLAFMVGLTTALVILVVLFPKIRHSAESVALSIPVLSLMGAFSSDVDGGLPTSTSVFGILLCYLIFTVYGGAWLDRYLPCRPRRLRSCATSKLPPEELWPYLTVTPDTFLDYGSKDTLSMEWIDPDVSYREIERSGELAKIEEINTIEVNEPHHRYRFTFEVPDATETAPVSQGSYEFRMTQNGHGTTLGIVREFDRVSIRAQLLIWIDDAMGRLDDQKIRDAETAHRD